MNIEEDLIQTTLEEDIAGIELLEKVLHKAHNAGARPGWSTPDAEELWEELMEIIGAVL